MTRPFQALLAGLCFLSASAYPGSNTPLHDAVESGDKAKVEALLSRGADVVVKGCDAARNCVRDRWVLEK